RSLLTEESWRRRCRTRRAPVRGEIQMRVYIARDVDHCFGVKRAINMTRQALMDNDDVFIMGDLIHNRAVTAELEACGLRTVDDVQGCASGTMVVRAHGLPRAQLQAAHDA